MKKYRYSQFSFPAQGNEKIIQILLDAIARIESDRSVEIRSGEVRMNLFVQRIFQWSNGNVTVVGDIL